MKAVAEHRRISFKRILVASGTGQSRIKLSKEDEALFDDEDEEDDELSNGELDELEAQLEATHVK